MTTWHDVYLRAVENDPGQVPSSFAGTGTSPDIVPAGTSALADPATTLTSTWNGFTPTPVEVSADNYFYVRGFNNGARQAGGTFALYWAEAALLLTPGAWSGNAIPADGGGAVVEVALTQPYSIALPVQAFLWADVPEPTTSSGYSLVATFQNGYGVPDPVPADPFTTPDALAAWMQSTPNVAYLNDLFADGDTGTASATVQISNNDANDARGWLFSCTCTDLPPETTVTVSCASGDPSPPLSFTTTITDSVQALWQSTTLPADWGPEPLVITAAAPDDATLAGGTIEISQWLQDAEDATAYVRLGTCTIYLTTSGQTNDFRFRRLDRGIPSPGASPC